MSSAHKIKNPAGVYFVTFTIIHWIDLFTRSAYYDILLESLRYCQANKGLAVHAFLIMPGYVHLVVSTK